MSSIAVGEARDQAEERTIEQAGETRSRQIESLRALAALSVLACHVALFHLVYDTGGAGFVDAAPLERLLYAGGYGVALFFALTGYLIFRPFARAQFAGADPIPLTTYARNRALRILPLYYAVLIVVLAAQGHPPSTWVSFLTFTENFSNATAGQVVGPAWSLVVELHFYVLLPLFALALGRVTGGSVRRAACILLVLGAASLAVRAITVYGADGSEPVWRYGLPANLLFFIPGMLLALVELRWERWRTAIPQRLAGADVWLAGGFALWLVVALGSFTLDFLIVPASLLAVGVCVLPLRRGRLAGSLSWQVPALIGIASYSLYLWHVPLLELLMSIGAPVGLPGLAAVAVPLALAVAWLSYATIEAPFLRLRGRWTN